MRLKIILLFMIGSLTSLMKVYAQHCAECDPCYGTYWVCDSEADDFQRDAMRNCGPGTNIEIRYVEGC